MLLFNAGPGRVAAVTQSFTQGRLSLTGVETDPIGFDTQRAIITSLAVGESVNLQFQHTLSKQIYVYVFGDRIGQVELSGMAFNGGCGNPNEDHGIANIRRWYHRAKASKRSQPVRVTFGLRDVIDGFVVSGSFGAKDPESLISTWSITMATLPEE